MALLRICALLSLGVALVAAQEMNDTDGMMGMDDFMAMPQVQFNDTQASQQRRNHFYCLDFGQSRADFPFDTYANGQLETAYTWAIFLQYPILSYLDTLRKNYLFEVILQLARAGDGSMDRLDALGLEDFCIARVFHNRVSDYQESVLINIYFRGNIVQHYPNGTGNPVSITAFDTYFRNGLAARPNSDSGSPLIATFRGQDALAVDSVIQDLQRLTMTEMNAHPFGTDGEGRNLAPEDDPTLRAVLIATNIGYVDVNNITYSNDSFASNPRPINFALEAGDYVFIVFGCFFLLIVLGLTLLGFCIHPFFLA